MPAVKNFKKLVPGYLRRSRVFYVLVIDPDGILRYVNPCYAERFKYVAPGPVGKSFESALVPEDVPVARKATERCLHGSGLPVQCRLRKSCGAGETVLTEWEFTPLAEEGQPEAVLALGKEVTVPTGQKAELGPGKKMLLNISRSIEDIYFTTDLDLLPTYISASVEKSMGYRPEEVIGSPLSKRFSPATCARFEVVLSEELEREKDPDAPLLRNREIEGVQFRADGEPRVVSIKVSFLRDEDKKPIGIQGITRDITASKEREKALLTAEERYEQIAECGRSVIWETDTEGKYTYINGMIEKLYGFKTNDIVGMLHFYDTHPAEGRETYKKKMLEKMRNGEVWKAVEKPMMDAYGKCHYLLSYGMPRYSADGTLIGYRGTDTEITARKEAELKLQASHERLESLADASRTVVWEIDHHGRYTFASSTSAKVYGHPPEAVVGKMFYELHPEAGREDFKKAGFAIIASGEMVTDLENAVEHPDGTVTWVNTTGIPLKDKSGKLIGYRGSDTDITERKLAEEALRDREMMLRNLLLEKDAATRMQKLLFEIAERFINIPLGEVGAAVDASLHDIGEYAVADRCYILRYSEQGSSVSVVSEWVRSGITPAGSALKRSGASLQKELRAAFSKPLIVRDLAEGAVLNIPASFTAGRSVRSLLAVPMKQNSGTNGLAVIETAEEPGDFGDRELRVTEIFIGLLLNVEEREHTEKELVRMQLMLEQAGQMSRVGAFELLPESDLHYWSAVTKSIYEVSPDYDPSLEKAIGFYKKSEDRAAVAEMVDKCMKTGKEFDFEYPIITAKGKERIVKVSGRGDLENGACHRLFGTIRDVTEQRKKEDKERILMEITQNQNDRLKNFAHIVAHNLRSHSGNIESLLGLIESTRDDLKDFDLMKLLRRVSDSLRDTLGHLSEVALLHSAEREPLRDLNLKAHVDRAVETVCGEALSAETDIAAKVSPQLTVKAIPAYLDSILLNFLTNAIKYRKPAEHCVVKIRAESDDRFVTFSVADNGLGIDLNRHGAKLFGMFKTFHEHPEARGIGLFITKNQIESMGGRVEVESTPGRGSTFSVKLLAGENK